MCPDEDDIESYWKGIRFYQEPVEPSIQLRAEDVARKAIAEELGLNLDDYQGITFEWFLEVTRSIRERRRRAGLPEESITVERGDPPIDPSSVSIEVDELGRMVRRPYESRRDFIERIRQFRGNSYSEALNEAEASINYARHVNPSEPMRRLENLQQSLLALGLPSNSISLGASGDQTIIIVFHRSPSVEVETTSTNANVSVTLHIEHE